MSSSSLWLQRFSVTAVAGVLLGAAGCTVGPKYARPAYPAPPAFRGTDDAAIISDAQGSLGDQQWAQVFREPELQALIRKALTNNHPLEPGAIGKSGLSRPRAVASSRTSTSTVSHT